MANYKRWISVMLSLAMMLTLLPMGLSVHAEEPEHLTVLILDPSEEMEGDPQRLQQLAAGKWLETADEENKIAVVAAAEEPQVIQLFTADPAALQAAVAGIGAEGKCNLTGALTAAQTLLEEAKAADTVCQVVICSQGIPDAGETLEEGRYTERDYAEGYTYANALYSAAAALREQGCGIDTLGFFHNYSGNRLTFAMRVLLELAGDGMHLDIRSAEDLEQADPNAPVSKRGVFYYPSFGGQDYTEMFYYDDDYFAKSSYEYQPSLATMTLGMALSAFGSTQVPNDEAGYLEKSMNLQYLLEECGFPAENYATNDAFREKPQKDSIGVGASHKTVVDEGEKYTLIAAAVRGGGYESEWASNFTIGKEGHHQGFDEASAQVLEYLRSYIADQEISGKIKLWITGYSRAAATTNLVAGALDNGYDLGGSVTLDPEDLYAYCYECPQGATNADDVEAERFGNIFNIVNPGDIVTKIAPSKPDQFGFQRYGVNCYLPTALKEGEAYNALLDAMLVHYNDLPSSMAYIVDDFQMKKISVNRLFWDPEGFFEEGIVVDDNDEKWDQNAFLDEVVFKLFNENVKTRDNYVDNYQDDMRELCKVLFGSGDKWDLFPDAFLENLDEKAPQIAACLILHLNRRLITIVENTVTDTLSELGITDYSADQIKKFVGKVVELFLPFAVNNPNLLVTTIDNIEGIGYAHLPELCLAWLQSFDPNYTADAQSAFNSGVHRVLRVNCPVDVYVRDAAGELVAAIVGEASQEVEGSSVVSFVNEQGEKLVYLPASGSYEVELKATGDGVMNYSIQEYSEEAGGVNRIVNYYEIALTDGSSYRSTIPAMTEENLNPENGVVYLLNDAEGHVIDPDEILNNEEAEQANCTVTAVSNDENLGAVTGSTVVKKGSYAQLTAIPNEGARFVGWFMDGELISEESEYRFCVTEDVELEGRFEAVDPEETDPTEPEETEPEQPEPTEPEATEPEKPEPTDPEATEPAAPEAHEHEFGEWVIVKEPTSKEEGLAERRCSCGAMETKVLPKLVNHFTDIDEDDYFFESVLWAVNHGITAGTSDTTFSPDRPCTRGQIVTFLWRAAGSPKPESTENPFVDVKREDYFYEPVLWAVENEITSGMTDKLFGPEMPCTRAHIVMFLYQFADVEAVKMDNPFVDVKPEDYFYEAVLWAVKSGITSGMDRDHFGSVLFCTRAQAVTFLHSLMVPEDRGQMQVDLLRNLKDSDFSEVKRYEIHKDGEQIALFCDKMVENLVIEWGSANPDGTEFVPEREICRMDQLQPDQLIVISASLSDVFPNIRIRYLGADGLTVKYVFQSGADGSLKLIDL